MALLKYYTKKELLSEGFTHYGKLFGIPVYIGEIDSFAPTIATANFIPEFILDIAQSIYFNLESLMNINNPAYEPCFRIRVKGKIE